MSRNPRPALDTETQPVERRSLTDVEAAVARDNVLVTAIDAPQLPEGTRLVHIGPHKTGTTTLQGAFHAARPRIERQGVLYATPYRQAGKAVKAVAGARSGRSHWANLVRELERSRSKRALISAESLSDAPTPIVRRITGDLGPAAIHVVATLRPLARILPSQWQQYVQNGLTLTYDAWLESVFNHPDRPVTPSFWRRHRHDQLLARWADVVGLDRVTAVVVDDRDHAGLLRIFERLLHLEPDTLELAEGIYNRSLTHAEVELVRAMHAASAEISVDRRRRLNLYFHGAAANMKLREPDGGEPRIETPAWAQERAAATARAIVDGIVASGVRVIGDLDLLVDPPRSVRSMTGKPASAERAWPTIAGRGLMGVLIQTGLTRGSGARDGAAWPDDAIAARAQRGPVSFEEWSIPRLRTIVIGRVRSAVKARLGRRLGALNGVLGARGRGHGRGRRGRAGGPSIHSAPMQTTARQSTDPEAGEAK